MVGNGEGLKKINHPIFLRNFTCRQSHLYTVHFLFSEIMLGIDCKLRKIKLFQQNEVEHVLLNRNICRIFSAAVCLFCVEKVLVMLCRGISRNVCWP